MLDDDTSGFRKRFDALERGIRIRDIIEGERFSLKLVSASNRTRSRLRVAIEGRGLVRILSVAKHSDASPAEDQGVGKIQSAAILLGEVSTDRGIISGGMLESGDCKTVFQVSRRIAVPKSIEYAAVVIRIYDDGDPSVILCRRSQHSGASDIDILDRVFDGAVIARDSGFEGIKVYDEQVDTFDPVLRQNFVVHPRSSQQAGVDGGVECLYAPSHDLGETRDVSDIGYGEARVAKRPGGTAGRDQLEREFGQASS